MDNLTETHDDTREKRTRIVLKRFNDFVVKLPPSIDHARPASHQASSTVHSLTNYISYDKFSDSHKAFLSAISSNEEPRSFKQARQDQNWITIMKNEIKALEDNGT